LNFKEFISDGGERKDWQESGSRTEVAIVLVTLVEGLRKVFAMIYGVLHCQFSIVFLLLPCEVKH
jgi:hypothetical protein